MTIRATRSVGFIALSTLAAMAASAWGAPPDPSAGEEVIRDVMSLGIRAPAPPSPRGPEAEGPFDRLIIRDVHVIDGTGAPPRGPVEITIERDRIVAIKDIGGTRAMSGPAAPASGARVIDGKGGYVLPGFVDVHEHIGTPTHVYGGSLTQVDYVLKLLLAHGITTVRDTGTLLGLGWTVDLGAASRRGEIAAPRILAYPVFPEPIPTPQLAREWVRAVHKKGASGVKFLGAAPEVFAAAIDELGKLGMGSAYHHSQLYVTRQNAVDSAALGLRSIEHWYGLPEAMFTDRTVQAYPPGYNYNDEQDRFAQAGRLWTQTAGPGTAVWESTIKKLVASKVTLNPTFVVYEVSRDLSRAQRLEWHDQYTMPYMLRSWAPNPRAHGSFFFDWSTGDEVAWRDNYRLWMRFVLDFKNAGGKVGIGADSGFMYNTYGFGYIREFEMMQEAGFHPLEVVRAATLHGAQLLRMDADIGTIAIGKKADLVLVAENPLRNLKVLYGTGHAYLDRTSGKMSVTTGITHTIKDGIVFDAKVLLQQVREMVSAEKQKR